MFFFVLYLLASNKVSSFLHASNSIPTALIFRLGKNDVRTGQPQSKGRTHCFQMSSSSSVDEEEVDVIVIGAGIGGLCCASLAAKYGLKTLCLEAHDTPGGCAHSFDRYTSASSTEGELRIPFRFDSGPSLLSGMSAKGTNPLRQVLDAIGVSDDIKWKKYNGWIVHDYSDGHKIKLTTGNNGEWENAIENKAGKAAREEFARFKKEMLKAGGLSESSGYIPPFSLRGGRAAARSISRYLLKLLSIGSKGGLLTGPFSQILDNYGVKHEFNRNWFDYLAFALSGLDAAHTQAAPVLYTMIDLHGPNAVLDYPMGGMGALSDILVAGLKKHGGDIRLNNRVSKLVLSERDGRACCTGVELMNGKKIHAKTGVVCNAPLWNMQKLLEDSTSDDAEIAVLKAVERVKARADSMEKTGSFMHLHLGIPSDGLPDDLECHHSVLNFKEDITAKQNLVIISIPTVFDDSLAPPGYHIVHAYTAASEDFSEWNEFLTDTTFNSPSTAESQRYNRETEYKDLKMKRAEALWKAVEEVIPDVRERAKRKGSITLIGTPLTHRRYNLRYAGTYGPAPREGKDVWELAGATTGIDRLLACGDTCFPGIGLPGVAASGTIAANTLVPVGQQLQLMDELRENGALQ